MSSVAQGQKSAVGNREGGKQAVSSDRKKPVRKVYEHEMTPAERFALQTVQRASAALKVINDAIKSGKPVKAEMVSLCQQINSVAGEMLFGQG